MAEWLYEAGIGEARAALVADGTIRKLRIEAEGTGPRVDTIAEAQLIDRATGRVKLDSGEEALCDSPPRAVTQGARLTVRITREAIPEPGRSKVARAVPAEPDATPAPGPDLLARITASGIPVRRCRAHEPDRLEAAGWSEILEEARTGEIAFPGGALRMAVTPAMMIFDVDGSGPLEPLAVAAAQAVATAVVRHGIGGSIGVDFPTLGGKAARNAVAETLDAALPQPFERTAVNGFGFMQIIRRRPRASLPELLAADPAGAAVRGELRLLERLPPPAPATHMLAGPRYRRLMQEPGWIAELHRRTGGTTQFQEQDDRR
ncbi:ribonuclease [Stakelama tenebrarum]|uniref:Ribonuclease n=1 Tax=Stakelama tenebrarum TaxID=2711215 RepID=A0A6G6Y2C6_9SPHN|nr:ribonuclease [Sphingosinithalassobacter tenebrarum]QIG79075.1 ribonuclease [Sphingosinithalassobacter tenebrarum]